MSDTSSPSSSDGEVVEGMPFTNNDIIVSDLIFEDSSFARGAFGRMVKADYFGVTVCVKILKKQRKKELAKFVHREMAALKTLSHPNLVQFIGVTEKGNEICLVTEYISGGTLRKLLKDQSVNIPWPIRVQIAVDIASAMAYLHSRKIMHRDLKSKNLLVGDNWKIKICDFGFARSVHDKKKAAALTFCGTEEYMAPEVIFGMEYDERAEVYSYGLLLCEIIVRRKVEETVPRTSNTNYGLDHQEFVVHVPRDCPLELVQLAFMCTEFEPKNRPEFREITQLLREIKQNINTTPTPPTPAARTTSPIQSSAPLSPKVTRTAPPPPEPAPVPASTPQASAPTSHASNYASTPQAPPPSQVVASSPKTEAAGPLQDLLPPPIKLDDASPHPNEFAQTQKHAQNGTANSHRTIQSSVSPAERQHAPAAFKRSPSSPIPAPQTQALQGSRELPKTTVKDPPRTTSKELPKTPPVKSAQPTTTARPPSKTDTVGVSPLTTPPTPSRSKPSAPTPVPSPAATPVPTPTRASSGNKLVFAPVVTPKSFTPVTATTKSPATSVSSTPPKSGVPVLPKVPAIASVASPNSSPRGTTTKDLPAVPKPAPPGRSGRPSLPEKK